MGWLLLTGFSFSIAFLVFYVARKTPLKGSRFSMYVVPACIIVLLVGVGVWPLTQIGLFGKHRLCSHSTVAYEIQRTGSDKYFVKDKYGNEFTVPASAVENEEEFANVCLKYTIYDPGYNW